MDEYLVNSMQIKSQSHGEVEVEAFDFEIIKLFKKRPPWLMPCMHLAKQNQNNSRDWERGESSF